jgi:hypothetical protein
MEKGTERMNIETIRGLVRPVISILLVLTAVYLAVAGKVESKEIITIVGMVVAFHFGERAATKKIGAEPKPDPETG